MNLKTKLELFNQSLRTQFGQEIPYIGRYIEQDKTIPVSVQFPAILTDFGELLFNELKPNYFQVEGFIELRLLTLSGNGTYADKNLNGIELLDKLLNWLTKSPSNSPIYYQLYSFKKLRENWSYSVNLRSGGNRRLKGFDVWKITLKSKWNFKINSNNDENEEEDNQTNKRGVSLDTIGLDNMVGTSPFTFLHKSPSDYANDCLKQLVYSGANINSFSLENDILTIKILK